MTRRLNHVLFSSALAALALASLPSFAQAKNAIAFDSRAKIYEEIDYGSIQLVPHFIGRDEVRFRTVSGAEFTILAFTEDAEKLERSLNGGKAIDLAGCATTRETTPAPCGQRSMVKVTGYESECSINGGLSGVKIVEQLSLEGLNQDQLGSPAKSAEFEDRSLDDACYRDLVP